MEKEKEAQWMVDSGLGKKLRWHGRLGCSIPFFIGLAALIVILFNKSLWWLALLAALLIFGVLRYSKFVFFHRIVCPKCGYNPTRRKADGAPRKDYYKVRNQLESYEDCPNCGDRNPNPGGPEAAE